MPYGEALSAFDSAMGNLSGGSVLPSNMNSAGNASQGMSDQQIGMVGAGIGAAADIGANIYSTYSSIKENEKARKESRELAEISRRDKLKQEKIDNQLRQRTLEQEKEQFEINKWSSSQDLRQQLYIQKLKKLMDNRAKLVAGFSKFKESAVKNADINNIILSSFRRK